MPAKANETHPNLIVPIPDIFLISLMSEKFPWVLRYSIILLAIFELTPFRIIKSSSGAVLMRHGGFPHGWGGLRCGGSGGIRR